MFTSHKQISPPSLVLKLKISEVSQKWIPKAVELKRIPTHKKCQCKKFCSQTRLVDEIYSSDVIMHRGYWIFVINHTLSTNCPIPLYSRYLPTAHAHFGLMGCDLSGGQKSGKICQHGKSRLSLFTPSKRFNNFSHVQNVQFEFGKSFMLNICLLWGHLLTYSHYCIQKRNNEHSYPEFVINVFKIPVNSCSFSVV